MQDHIFRDVHQVLLHEIVEEGIAVLVEKPISCTIEEASEMVRLSERGGVALQVGHLERFNPAVQAIRGITTKPRFFEAHRLSIFTPRSLDVDVVMDLMIHDIDIVLSLVNSAVVDIRAAGVPVVTPRVDIANARLEFENGCVANLTASRVSSERVRKLRFFQPDEYISIDYSTQEATAVYVDRSNKVRPEFKIRMLHVEGGEPLKLEIRSFLDAVTGGSVQVSGAAGLKALEIALLVAEKIRRHAEKLGIVYPG